MYPHSIPLCSLLTPFLKLRYLSWTSHSASPAAQLVLQFTTRTPTPTTTYTTPLLILSTAKTVFHIPSSCASAVFALRMMTSCRNAKRCPPFSKAVAIPPIYCRTLGKECPPLPTKKRSRNVCVKTKKELIPLVLTYHPLSSRVKHILLNPLTAKTTYRFYSV